MRLNILFAAAALMSGPALAKWSAVPASTPAAVASSKLSVVPSAGWNRWSKKPVKQSELWSFDGPLLNQIEFYGGLTNGQPFARERNKKREPLAKFTPAMKATEIAEAFEQTIRVTQGAPDFAIDQIEPVTFAGANGFRFAYHFTTGELVRKGEARGAIIGGKLFMIVYSAPALHYFDAHLAAAHGVMDSAKVD